MKAATAVPEEVLQVFETLPDLYLVLSPELTILTASDAYLKATSTQRSAIVGQSVFDVFQDNPTAKSAYAVENLHNSLRQVVDTKQPHRMPMQHYDVALPTAVGGGFANKYWLPQNTPVLDEQGQVLYIIHKVEDVTEHVAQAQRVKDLEQESHQHLREREEMLQDAEAVGFNGSYEIDSSTKRFHFSENIYQLVVESTPDHITRWNKDLKLAFANKAAEQKMGMTRTMLLGKTNLEMGQPAHIARPWMEKLQQVFDMAEPAELYSPFPTPTGEKFFFSRLVPEFAPDGSVQSVLAIARDITDLKTAEKELAKEHRRLKEAQAVGHTGSFEWVVGQENIYWSDELYRIYGLVPQSEPITLARSVGFIHPEDAAWVKAEMIRSQQKAGIGELSYRIIRPDGEVRFIYRRYESFANEEGYVTHTYGTVHDITEQKKAEQEVHKNLTLLRQAEEVALMGSWEYDIATETLLWSEGMYRLFSLPVHSAVAPETYLQYVIKEDRSIAEEVVRRLRESHQPFEETMRIRVDEQVLTLKLKGIVPNNEQERPEKVLGVGLDISEIKRLEEENLQLKLKQQKALMLAILDAQEEERKRISESLHNGVSQILFATKLNLEQLAQHAPQKTFKTVENLLIEAINETRIVSHELVPVSLQEYGLEEALKEICHRYEKSNLFLHCHFYNLQERLENYLEVALYRIIQELVNNIVKHSEATAASIQLRKQDGHILLQVKDNGKGLRRGKGFRKGIGLWSIENRVKLLSGTFSITTPKSGNGTLITIKIPAQI